MAANLRRIADVYADRLHLLGNQQPDRLFPALAAADVVALPSLWEAFGLVALESMALGRATVLTSGSGFQEFCRDGTDGVMVPPGDASALADALVQLLRDPERRERLGASAVRRAQEFDLAPMADRHVAYFEQVADNS